jgi:predicted RND superfamily exporter protein
MVFKSSHSFIATDHKRWQPVLKKIENIIAKESIIAILVVLLLVLVQEATGALNELDLDHPRPNLPAYIRVA